MARYSNDLAVCVHGRTTNKKFTTAMHATATYSEQRSELATGAVPVRMLRL